MVSNKRHIHAETEAYQTWDAIHDASSDDNNPDVGETTGRHAQPRQTHHITAEIS